MTQEISKTNENSEGCQCSHKGHQGHVNRGMGHGAGRHHEGGHAPADKEHLLKQKEHLQNRLKAIDQTLETL